MALNSSPYYSCIMERGRGPFSEQLFTHILLKHISYTVTPCFKAGFHSLRTVSNKAKGRWQGNRMVFPPNLPLCGRGTPSVIFFGNRCPQPLTVQQRAADSSPILH